MLKLLGQSAAQAALLALLIFLVVTTVLFATKYWWSGEPESEATALTRYTFWLVVVTAVLAGSTAGLWWYAAEQSRDMKVSLKATRDAADAAKDAVNSTRNIERAYLFLDNDTTSQLGNFSPQPPATDPTNPESPTYIPGNSVIMFRFTNYGNTPGVLKTIHVSHRVQRNRITVADQNSIPAWTLPMFAGMTVIPAKGNSRKPGYPFDLKVDQLHNIQSGHDRLFFFWYIEYDDIFGNSYVHGFCDSFEPTTKTFTPEGNELNYQKTISSSTRQ